MLQIVSTCLPHHHLSNRKMQFIEDSEVLNVPVEDQYAGKSVFITGGTGFLGKVFVEKLLYSCPKIDKIYLLMRKKNKTDTTTERIKQLLDLSIFQRIKNERSEDLKKIVPVEGDVLLSGLGLCDEDKESLTEKVTYVFHFAANIKFNEPLKVALDVNLEGTRRVLKLCQNFKNIKAFVYVSTAFSNTDQIILEEIVYPPPATLDEIYEIIENEENNEDQVKRLIYGRPNTYTFTKALAETLVKKERGDVPTVIIRPSIVSASYSEPLMGWVDNWFGATALITTIARGLTRIIISKKSNVIDLIPVDYVSNLTIVAAAKGTRSEEVAVYNSCTSATNPLTMGVLFQFVAEDSSQNERSELMKPSLIFTQYEWLLKFITVIMQIIPAFVADCFLRLVGKTPRFMKIQKRISLVRDSLQYFTSRTWTMKCDRTRELFASLSVPERVRFPFDPAHIVWSKYIPIYLNGIKEFMFK